MVHQAKEAMDPRTSPSSLQHTHPWKASEGEADRQKRYQSVQKAKAPLWKNKEDPFQT